jgi:hypothetical protein
MEAILSVSWHGVDTPSKFHTYTVGFDYGLINRHLRLNFDTCHVPHLIAKTNKRSSSFGNPDVDLSIDANGT